MVFTNLGMCQTGKQSISLIFICTLWPGLTSVSVVCVSHYPGTCTYWHQRKNFVTIQFGIYKGSNFLLIKEAGSLLKTCSRKIREWVWGIPCSWVIVTGFNILQLTFGIFLTFQFTLKMKINSTNACRVRTKPIFATNNKSTDHPIDPCGLVWCLDICLKHTVIFTGASVQCISLW